LAVNEFLLEVFQGVIIELELPFEGAIGDASAALEHGYRVVEDLPSKFIADSPCALRLAGGQYRIGDAVRAHVYHSRGTKKSGKYSRMAPCVLYLPVRLHSMLAM
jgi:hypothetical protein